MTDSVKPHHHRRGSSKLISVESTHDGDITTVEETTITHANNAFQSHLRESWDDGGDATSPRRERHTQNLSVQFTDFSIAGEPALDQSHRSAAHERTSTAESSAAFYFDPPPPPAPGPQERTKSEGNPRTNDIDSFTRNIRSSWGEGDGSERSLQRNGRHRQTPSVQFLDGGNEWTKGEGNPRTNDIDSFTKNIRSSWGEGEVEERSGQRNGRHKQTSSVQFLDGTVFDYSMDEQDPAFRDTRTEEGTKEPEPAPEKRRDRAPPPMECAPIPPPRPAGVDEAAVPVPAGETRKHRRVFSGRSNSATVHPAPAPRERTKGEKNPRTNDIDSFTKNIHSSWDEGGGEERSNQQNGHHKQTSSVQFLDETVFDYSVDEPDPAFQDTRTEEGTKEHGPIPEKRRDDAPPPRECAPVPPPPSAGVNGVVVPVPVRARRKHRRVFSGQSNPATVHRRVNTRGDKCAPAPEFRLEESFAIGPSPRDIEGRRERHPPRRRVYSPVPERDSPLSTPTSDAEGQAQPSPPPGEYYDGRPSPPRQSPLSPATLAMPPPVPPHQAHPRQPPPPPAYYHGTPAPSYYDPHTGYPRHESALSPPSRPPPPPHHQSPHPPAHPPSHRPPPYGPEHPPLPHHQQPPSAPAGHQYAPPPPPSHYAYGTPPSYYGSSPQPDARAGYGYQASPVASGYPPPPPQGHPSPRPPHQQYPPQAQPPPQPQQPPQPPGAYHPYPTTAHAAPGQGYYAPDLEGSPNAPHPSPRQNLPQPTLEEGPGRSPPEQHRQKLHQKHRRRQAQPAMDEVVEGEVSIYAEEKPMEDQMQRQQQRLRRRGDGVDNGNAGNAPGHKKRDSFNPLPLNKLGDNDNKNRGEHHRKNSSLGSFLATTGIFDEGNNGDDMFYEEEGYVSAPEPDEDAKHQRRKHNRSLSSSSFVRSLSSDNFLKHLNDDDGRASVALQYMNGKNDQGGGDRADGRSAAAAVGRGSMTKEGSARKATATAGEEERGRPGQRPHPPPHLPREHPFSPTAPPPPSTVGYPPPGQRSDASASASVPPPQPHAHPHPQQPHQPPYPPSSAYSRNPPDSSAGSYGSSGYPVQHQSRPLPSQPTPSGSYPSHHPTPPGYYPYNVPPPAMWHPPQPPPQHPSPQQQSPRVMQPPPPQHMRYQHPPSHHMQHQPPPQMHQQPPPHHTQPPPQSNPTSPRGYGAQPSSYRQEPLPAATRHQSRGRGSLSPPPGVCQTAEQKRARRKCSFPECPNRVVQGGLCIAHGAKRKICSHPGCTKNVKKAGLCSAHGPARKRCEVEGCVKVAVQGGRCIAHGAKKRVCSVEACTKQSILGGMCKKHYDEANGVQKLPRGRKQKASPQVGRGVARKGHERGLSMFQDDDLMNTIINNGVQPSS